MLQVGSHGMNFLEICYLGLLREFGYCRTKISDTLREDKSTFRLTAVRIILFIDSSTKGNHCSICMAKLQAFTLLTAKCGSTTVKRRRIVAFPLQQWLHDRVTMLGTPTLPTL